MPRIRSVHPDICEDDVLASCSAYAERTFVRLWTYLDDRGRGVDNAKLIKGRLYPLDDSMTVERVERDLAELAAKGLLQRYEVDSKRYLAAKERAWSRWQKPQHPTPSKLPPPPNPSTSPQEDSGGLMSPHPVVVVGEERSCNGEEGESEGEPEQEPGDSHPRNALPVAQRARELAQRAALRAEEPALRAVP